MRQTFLFGIVFLLILCKAEAKEGMWIPTLLEKYTISEMQEMGFKLSANDIYDINNSSMKDATVLFGTGCTGEFISNSGLLITNHHCGLKAIQSHSTVDHDYLMNGFWAEDQKGELQNQNLSVRILEYMEDVTDKVFDGTDTIANEDLKSKKINANLLIIEKEARQNGKFETIVKPLFYGNQYYLYVYNVFKDVRLVGAPPSSIGRFGGDTDNWMWPRHTGDFSMFRVYADKDNNPSSYSEENVPYQPKYFFPISVAGVKPGDFTMIYGFPGSTQQYLPAAGVNLIQNQRDPERIKIRDLKLAILNKAMENDPKVRIQYAAKYSSVSNAWKKWQGEIVGLERLEAINKKLEFEEEYKNWAISTGQWDSKYKQVFEKLDRLYAPYSKAIFASDYYSEIVWKGTDVFLLANTINGYLRRMELKDERRKRYAKRGTIRSIQTIYKNYDQQTDEKLFVELFQFLKLNLEPVYLPKVFNQNKLFDDKSKLLNKLYRKSVLTNQAKLEAIVLSGDPKQLKKLKKDPLMSLFLAFRIHYDTGIKSIVDVLESEINSIMKDYMAGIMEKEYGNHLWPDANLTLRLGYGKVEGFMPNDAVKYKYQSTATGIQQKFDSTQYEFNAPEKLRLLISKKDFGIYGANGNLPICFLASNHTSGGNSGSPVINAKGHLIGLNFDRTWEGTMSDIMYDPSRCRNIVLDIRYALFLIDKFAGAGYLLNEMEIVN